MQEPDTPVPAAAPAPTAPDPALPGDALTEALAPVPDAPAEPVAEASAPTAAPDASPATAPTMGPAACGQALATHFPALFDPAQPPRPLKLRIQADIQQRAPGVFTRKALGLYFSRFTTSTAYLKALVQSPQRYDLDGQAAGEVAEEHRQAAQAELDRRRELVMQRRAAERQAARPARPPNPARPERGERPTGTPPSAPGTSAAPGPDAHPRPDRADGQGRRGPRPDRGPRSGRPERGDRPARAERPAHPNRSERPPRDAARPIPAQRQAGPRVPVEHDTGPAALPADPAQRDRALLLRQFESSPLSKANFCVLKGLSEAELDARLAQARDERAPRQAGAKR